MLSTVSLSKSFYDQGRGDIFALADLSVQFPIGITALVGANGSGKTTLLRVLAGLMKPDSGSLTWAGETIDQTSVSWRSTIGFCTLSTKPPSRMRVREYLLFIARMHRIPEPHERVREVMERLDISKFSDSFGDRLSTGQIQRCILAVAIIHEPKVLLLDELTTGLDIIARNDILNLVTKAGLDHRVVVFATHHPMEIERIAHRIVALRAGSVVIDAPVSVLGKGTDLEDSMISIVNGSCDPIIRPL